MELKKFIAILFSFLFSVFCMSCTAKPSQEAKDAKQVNSQQTQYAIGQPVPVYNWSLERQMVIDLYNVRNRKVTTHAVWRSDYGLIEGDCPCMGYGIPYDTSLTNPLKATDMSDRGFGRAALTSIGQAEPNGIFASTSTSATWITCIGDGGFIEPIYTESKVTVYPGPVIVDYDKNRVTRSGAATVRISATRK